MIYKITLNDVMYEVSVEEDDAMIVSENAISTSANSNVSSTIITPNEPIKSQNTEGANIVTAPMPGVIVNIMISEGQSVKKGQPILILEAMKMENEIVSSADGIVASILAKKGSNVQTGDILVTIK